MLIAELEIPKLLRLKNIAVVGLANDPQKASYQVAQYLIGHGYRVVPINPNESKVLGQKAYPSLMALPEELQRQIEIVDVFRRPELVIPHVQEAIVLRQKYRKLQCVWLQLGIKNGDAKQLAERAGLKFIEDRCIMTEHSKRVKR